MGVTIGASADCVRPNPPSPPLPPPSSPPFSCQLRVVCLLISGSGFRIRPCLPGHPFILGSKCGTLSRLACRNISIDGVDPILSPVIRPPCRSSSSSSCWAQTNLDLARPGRPDLQGRDSFPTRRTGTKKKWIRPREQQQQPDRRDDLEMKCPCLVPCLSNT